MKRIIKLIIILPFIFTILNINAIAETEDKKDIGIEGECGILIEATSGRVLYENNAEARRAPASTTKIMTALIVLENAELDSVVTVPQAAVGIEGSSVYLGLGERLTVKELLYALMLRSGNDAATALALHVSNNINEFAELMNIKANELGLENTNFQNPTGLPDEEHYTTAHDLAIIAAEAMKNDVFKQIVATEKINISWDGKDCDRLLVNKNKMLFQYDGANGIKTGYTMAAGRCLVASATRNGMTLISVVLNSSPMYKDCSEMLDYGFNNFDMFTAINAGEMMGNVKVKNGFIDNVGYIAEQDMIFPLKRDDEISITVRVASEYAFAPITKGETAAWADIYINNELIKSAELVYAESTGENTFWARFQALIKSAANSS